MADNVRKDQNPLNPEEDANQSSRQPNQNTEVSKDTDEEAIPSSSTKTEDEVKIVSGERLEEMDVDEDKDVVEPEGSQTQIIETEQDRIQEKSIPVEETREDNIQSSTVDDGGNVIEDIDMEEAKNEETKSEDADRQIVSSSTDDFAVEQGKTDDDNNTTNDPDTETSKEDEDKAMDCTENDDTPSETQENVATDTTDDITGKYGEDVKQDIVQDQVVGNENDQMEVDNDNKNHTEEDNVVDAAETKKDGITEDANREEAKEDDDIIMESIDEDQKDVSEKKDKEKDDIIDDTDTKKDAITGDIDNEKVDITVDVNKEKEDITNDKDKEKDDIAENTQGADRTNEKNMEEEDRTNDKDKAEEDRANDKDKEEEDITHEKDKADDDITSDKDKEEVDRTRDKDKEEVDSTSNKDEEESDITNDNDKEKDDIADDTQKADRTNDINMEDKDRTDDKYKAEEDRTNDKEKGEEDITNDKDKEKDDIADDTQKVDITNDINMEVEDKPNDKDKAEEDITTDKDKEKEDIADDTQKTDRTNDINMEEENVTNDKEKEEEDKTNEKEKDDIAADTQKAEDDITDDKIEEDIVDGNIETNTTPNENKEQQIPIDEEHKKDDSPGAQGNEENMVTDDKDEIDLTDEKSDEKIDEVDAGVSSSGQAANENMEITMIEDESNETSEEPTQVMDADTTTDDANMESTDLPIIDSFSSNEPDSNKDNDAIDSTMDDENSIFMRVDNDKDDSDKSGMPAEHASNEIDPIGSAEWCQTTEPTNSRFGSEWDDADECIIPDASKEGPSSVRSSQESNSTPVVSTSTDTDSMKLSEKYLVSVASSEEPSQCMICNEKSVCRYICTKDTVKTNLCSEECLTKLKEKYTDNVIVRKLRVKNFGTDLLSAGDATEGLVYCPNLTVAGIICCKHCGSPVVEVRNSFSWEAFDFCDEQCLTKHQKLIGSSCANCHIEVKENFLGKYCVRFGYNVRQFCSSTCLEQYKKNSKVCSFCQDDISGSPATFLTSIAEKGVTKDFCSAHCMQRYNQISKHLKGPKTIEVCDVCKKHTVIEVEFELRNRLHFLCSDPCFIAFKYVNDVAPEQCDMCGKYFVGPPVADNFLIRYDGELRKFCQKTCQNIYITSNRRIVSCCWCKVKKYNFDMIQKFTYDNVVRIICSLTCLNFFNTSLNASKVKKKRCDYCSKICKGQYHITLADDSLKNFCSYPCVQEYQNKYIIAPARFSEQPVASPSTRITRKTSASMHRKQIIPDLPGPLPIITSVRSLAPTTSSQSMNTRSMRSRSSSSAVSTIATLQEPVGPPIRRIILVKRAELPPQRNMATLAKPITADAEANFKPVMVDKSVQTEDLKDSLVLLPVPVPIYVPSPMQMFTLTLPRPIPFPLPVPVPIFIPVTKQTASVVLKEIKKNQVRAPTDPYEADLLMMAELVAGESDKKETAESEAEAESEGDTAAEPFSPEATDANTSFGDDMLQMALKMATGFEEPAVDLEGALTASTITATQGNTTTEQIDTPLPPPVERNTFRGKRRGRPPRHGGRGRGRGRPPTQPDVVPPVVVPPPPPPEPVEKPDADMCLKYTFGVNAWKQWVTTKNAELEKSSRRAKPFKSDLLQLTPDELNYSLCLFVKEVRKPNGAEYAPDTIYYLCLGIQQYLFENTRIDNIFCDTYYESFTDCLDEVCKKFSTLYNDSQYIVTRVEEEHLWESKQLGAHSPHVLLSTLMFFNTKHFNLTNVDEHMQLSFSHIMKHWKRVPNQPGTPKNSSSRNILLRFYPPQSAVEGNNRKKKVYEQQENEENPLRCPVKLYEFYLSKCPESVKTRNDVFYLLPERSCVPDSPVWYSTMALGKEPLTKMLHRVKMVKEINVALLAS